MACSSSCSRSLGLAARPTDFWQDRHAIRADLFGIERLEHHAISLATEHRVAVVRGSGRALSRRLKDNAAALLAAYHRGELAQEPAAPEENCPDCGADDSERRVGLGQKALAIGVFVVAWIGQFIGHKIEGRRPSFLTDLVYLLVGPLWTLSKLYKRLGWTW